MEQKDFRRFKDYMALIGEICGVTATQTKLEIYWNILKRYPAKRVFAGFESLMLQKKMLKFPSPGDILAATAIDPEITATKAWDRVKYAIARHGYMDSVQFDDPVIHYVIKTLFGGWKKLCSMPLDEEKFYRPQFIKLYIKCKDAHEKGELSPPAYLPGEAETNNIALGYNPPKVKQIGHRETPAITHNETRQLEEGGKQNG